MSDPTATTLQPRLAERLCLALALASRAMTHRYRGILADLGLTYPQYLVMALLWQDGPTTVGGIGEQLGLDSSTLSPLLKRLEAADLLRRERSAGDERVVEVSLTRKGSALRRRATSVPSAVSAATGMSDREQQDLVARLRRLVESLEG